MRRCLSCAHFLRGDDATGITFQSDKFGDVACSVEDSVIDEHGRYSLKEWLIAADLENDCDFYSSINEDKKDIPVIRLSKEYGNGIATVRYPNGSVYEYYGIEPPAYRKMEYVLHKKSMPQNAKASIILKKLKAGEKAGNYKVTKMSECSIDNVIDNIIAEDVEYVLWGIRKGEPDWSEEIITKATSKDDPKLQKAKRWASNHGFDRFRIAQIGDEPPDFLSTIKEAEYQGKKVTLNKPFRTPKGPKKFSVYVKNDKGNVVKVNFGDPDMEIKRDDPDRRKSFRARHKCDNPGPKWKPRYWSCKFWSSKSVSDLLK